MIESQVKLPISIAMGVVLQGIRIRFGRSVITILGVVFGIAFLMSILTSMIIKKGVKEEDDLRAASKSMYSFLTYETGPPADRVLGVVQCGPLNNVERRLLKALDKDKPTRFLWAGDGSPSDLGLSTPVDTVDVADVGAEASAVILLGEGNAPVANWTDVLAGARQKVLAYTRTALATSSEGASSVSLVRELKEDEIEKMKEEATKARFRNGWIITVSILVTIIGISNAMLMSVTERFREIGTMKCLGAMSVFIRQIFLLESSIMGLVGGFVGSVSGALFSILIYSVSYGFGLVLGSLNFGLLLAFLFCTILAGVILSIIAAIYPASVASRMVPAVALRSNV